MELAIVILLFTINIMLAFVAWSIVTVNKTLFKQSIQLKSQNAEVVLTLRKIFIRQEETATLLSKIVRNKGLS